MIYKLLVSIISNPLAIAAILLPFIVNKINNNRAKLAEKAKFEEEELKQAQKIADDICNHADRLIYFNEEALYGITERGLNITSVDKLGNKWTAYDLKAWDNYRQELQDWNACLTRRRAETEVYFGEDTRIVFYKVVKLIEYTERMTNAAFYKQDGSLYFIDNTDAGDDFDTSTEGLLKLFQNRRGPLKLEDILGSNTRIRRNTDPGSNQKPFTTSYKYKFRPIYYHLKDVELLALRKSMMQAMQKKDVGALRMNQQYRPLQS